MNFELNISDTSINDFDDLYNLLNHDLDLQLNSALDNINYDTPSRNDFFDSLEQKVDDNSIHRETPKVTNVNERTMPKTVDVFITNPKQYQETNDINTLETKEVASTFDSRDISNLEEELYKSKVLYQRPILRSVSSSEGKKLAALNIDTIKQNAGYSVIDNSIDIQAQYLNAKENDNASSKTPMSAFSYNIFSNERSISPLVTINMADKDNSQKNSYPCFNYKKIIDYENIKRMSPKKEDFDIKSKIKSKIKSSIAKHVTKDKHQQVNNEYKEDKKLINVMSSKKISKKSSFSNLNNDNKSLKEKRSTSSLRKKQSMTFDHKHMGNAELNLSSSLSLTTELEDEILMYPHYSSNVFNDRLRSSSFLSDTTTCNSRSRNNSHFKPTIRDEKLSELAANEDEFDFTLDENKESDHLDSMLEMSHIKLIKKDSNGTNSEEAVNNLSDLDISENDATSAFKLARKQSFKK